MKIEKFKKDKHGKYTLILEDNSELSLYEDIIIKNELLIKKEVDVSLIDKLIDDNNSYEAYDKALSLIEKKLRSERELRNILDDMGFTKKIVDGSLDRLIKEGYINDNLYAKSFVNDKVLLTSWGPYKISKALSDLVDEDIIMSAINNIDDSVWKERVEKLVKKKAATIKGKSIYMVKNKVNQYMFDLGYDSDMISEEVDKLDISEEDALKKEMSKAYDKLSKKYSGNELNRQIKNHLYKKGFKVSNME